MESPSGQTRETNEDKKAEQEETVLVRDEFTDKHWLSTETILAKGITLGEADSYRIRNYKKQFGVGMWYESLKQHTFFTQMVSLTYEEGLAWNEYMNALRHVHVHNIQVNRSKEGTLLSCPELPSLVLSLQTRLQVFIDEYFPSGFFAKLDTRSPKDAPLYGHDILRYQEDVRKEFALLKERSENNDVIAFTKAQNKSFQLNTAKEVIEMFMESYRISEDLSGVLAFGERFFDCQIVFRRWNAWVAEHPEAEFRAFVYKGELNAVTQYFTSSYFPVLVEQKEVLSSRIRDFWKNEIRGLLMDTHESYVIDFLVKSDQIFVVELNPFYKGAGAGCFSWAKDRHILMHGPFEFRVLSAVPANCRKSFITPPWIRFIDSLYPLPAQTKKKAVCVVS